MLASVCAWLIKYNDHRKEKRQACQEHRVDDEGNLTCQCPRYAPGAFIHKSEAFRPTRVFYCTKTFAQLAQVVEEYSRFPYYKDGTLRYAHVPTFVHRVSRSRHTVLAGREKLCVNKAVLSSCGSNSSAITTKCHNKLQTKGVRLLVSKCSNRTTATFRVDAVPIRNSTSGLERNRPTCARQYALS